MDQQQKDDLMQSLHRLKKVNSLPPIAGVSRGEFFMLHKISTLCKKTSDEDPGIKISRLSAATEMSRPAVSQMLNSLENKGLIERLPTRDDRRVVFVRLTSRGNQQLQRAAEKMNALLMAIVERLGPEDTAELTRLFKKLYQILMEINDSGENSSCSGKGNDL